LDGSWGKGINLNGYNDGDLVKQELPGGVLLMYQSFVAATGFAASPRSFFFCCSAVLCGAECAELSGAELSGAERSAQSRAEYRTDGAERCAARSGAAERRSGGAAERPRTAEQSGLPVDLTEP
jgi:hypothetical protein